jgi:alkylation response protein AidB-like acyl-CoA dehydrogenase
MSAAVSVDFALEDRAVLAQSVQRFAGEEYSFEKRRVLMTTPEGYGTLIWRQIAELGWLGIGLPEEVGGAGGLRDVCVIAESIGRHIMMEPFVSSVVVSARLIARLGTTSQRAELARVVRGERILVLAHSERELGFARSPVGTRAVGGRLTGAKQAVLDAPNADAMLISARDADGTLGVYLVERDAPGLSIQDYRTVDGRRAANLVLDAVRAQRLGEGGDAFEALDAVLDEATVVSAAEGVGAIAATLDKTIAYLKEREQFGQKLAKFQVLQHRMVDMLVALRETEAMIDVALAAVNEVGDERRASVSALKVQLCRAARFVGQNGVHLHGGMGLTDELEISHWFKRLMMIEALFGDAAFHVERYARAAQNVDVTL